MSNNGAILAGGFAAGIYTTNEPAACEFIISDSSARVVVVDGQKQLDKILEIDPSIAVILITAYGDVDKAVRAVNCSL